MESKGNFESSNRLRGKRNEAMRSRHLGQHRKQIGVRLLSRLSIACGLLILLVLGAQEWSLKNFSRIDWQPTRAADGARSVGTMTCAKPHPELGLFLGSPMGVAYAEQKSSMARIKIDIERAIGKIDKMIYGNFIEHLGRCIEGGVFQEGSPLSDANGYRKDVFDAVKSLQVSILRWPGGNFASGYHWEDGIGPRDQRPARLELAWGTTESNHFGTHEFLNYCELLATQPYICVNLGTGTWDEAKFWVEYCNVKGGTRYSELRKRNGREKPWGVTYWGLGNEMDGPWQMGHRSAEDYGKFALEAAKLMRWTDPTI